MSDDPYAPVDPNASERPPVESEVIYARDYEPMGDDHQDADPAPRPESPAPSYEAGQGVGGRDANPGGGTDPNNTQSEAGE